MKAQELFQEISESKKLDLETIIHTKLFFCESLFYELQLTEDKAFLPEIKENLTQLLTITQREHLYPLAVEVSIIFSRLAMIEKNFGLAKTTVTEIKHIINEKGMNFLLDKIIEEERLQKQQIEYINQTEDSFQKRLAELSVSKLLDRLHYSEFLDYDQILDYSTEAKRVFEELEVDSD